MIKNLIIEASNRDPAKFVIASQRKTHKVICKINERVNLGW